MSKRPSNPTMRVAVAVMSTDIKHLVAWSKRFEKILTQTPGGVLDRITKLEITAAKCPPPNGKIKTDVTPEPTAVNTSEKTEQRWLERFKAGIFDKFVARLLWLVAAVVVIVLINRFGQRAGIGDDEKQMIRDAVKSALMTKTVP